MNRPLNIAIVGAGKAGNNLANAFVACSKTRIIRIMSRSMESARNLAKAYCVERFGTDLSEVVSDKDVDAVVIASPDKFHYQQVVAAARAGKHILCEKPMCRSLEEADQMIEEAKRNNVLLMIGFTERFNHPCLEAKRKIDSDEIGLPRMILARRCHPRSIVRCRKWLNDNETGGVLNYAGTHNIDLICWLMGSTPERVYAEMGQLILKEQNFTDCAVMTFKFANGSIATLYETFGYPESYPHGVDRSLEVLGDKGVIHINFMLQPLNSFSSSGHQLSDSLTWPEDERGIGGALLAEVEHFVRCIIEKRTPLTPGETGRLSLQIAIAARKAAIVGSAVKINSDYKELKNV